MATTREILVSAGATAYVGGTVAEASGQDISTATFKVSLGSRTNPGAWVDPTVSAAGSSNAERVVKLLVDNTTPRGAYYCWVKIIDAPEIEALIFPLELVIR